MTVFKFSGISAYALSIKNLTMKKKAQNKIKKKISPKKVDSLEVISAVKAKTPALDRMHI